jgi:hypothetical protein
MLSEQARILETLDQAREFIAEHADVLADVIPSNALVHFEACHKRMRTHVVVQAASARAVLSDSQLKARLRDRLAGLMRRVRVVARARRVESPALLEILREKRPRSFTAHVNSARGLAKAAEPHHESFVAGGLRPDFIDELVATAEALARATAAKGSTESAGVGATTGLQEEASKARLELELIGSYIRDRWPGSSLLARWESVTRIEPPRRKGLRKGEDVPAIGPVPTLRALPAGPPADPPLTDESSEETTDHEPPTDPSSRRRPILRRIVSVLGGGDDTAG